ncbi:MAG: ABC transporter ATP-binding protein [Desulfobacterales bacterium]|nr:ABC transporter ATP-binding protein [Desulfobacterales bacterium]
MDNVSGEELVRLEGVSKSFTSPTATLDILKDADFSLYKGETVAVVGASGIGKSTFLNMVGTLDRPDGGRVLHDSRDLFSLDDDSLARFRNKNIGFVFQFHYLLQGFSAMENVAMPGYIGDGRKKRVEKQALNMLDKVGLTNRAHSRVEDLSGGEQQRVAIARALVQHPRLLLADEPTGNLDRENSEEIHQLLRELNSELGMTVMVVTHNPHLADLMDRRVSIKENRIIPVK